MTPHTLLWLDGHIVPYTHTLPLGTHTLHYGTGAFEGIRSYATPQGTRVFRLQDHIKRFMYSISAFHHTIPWQEHELCDAVIALLRATHAGDCYIRPIFFLGDENIAINAVANKPHIAILAYAILPSETVKSLRVCWSPWRRVAATALPLDKKLTGTYLNSLLAQTTAIEQGFDDALLLDNEGMIAEATAANVAFIEHNALYTPPAKNILPGITRDTIFKLATHEHITAQEISMPPARATKAQSAFLMGTMYEITPIASLQDIQYDVQHPLVRHFIQEYRALVTGTHALAHDWSLLI